VKEHIFQLLKAVARGLAVALMELGDRREHERRANIPACLKIDL